MPFLRYPASIHFRGPGDVTPLRELCSAGAAEPDGTVLSTSRLRLRELFPGPTTGICDARRDIQRIRVFFVVLGHMARACEEIHGTDDRTFSAYTKKPRRRNRQQRRLSPPILRGARYTGSRYRACTESCIRRRRQGNSDDRGVLREGFGGEG